jgi:short-subunit dehydrogenase
MVARGAKNIVLLSPSGAKNDNTKKLIVELEEKGCKVKVYACDICDESRLKEVLDDCKKTMPPVKGCIQAAMFLQVTFHLPLDLPYNT